VRLSSASLAQLPESIIRPQYDRALQKAGIVHFGIGAFHRAHQAVYTDDAMNDGDRDWGILGVSLRSAKVAEQMNPQDGLFTVAARSGTDLRTRLIGAVQRVIVAQQDPEAVVAAIAAPSVHMVTFTITEKGYCRSPDGSLDLNIMDEVPVYTYLTAAFRRRMQGGLAGLTLLSCDNLAGNGAHLDRLMRSYLKHNAPDLLGWFGDSCTCPSTMVDRIVPATSAADLDAAQAALGLRDEAHVVTEAFSQWVIEDKFAGPRPRWEAGGAEFVADVAPYETAKLRMLNGAHSALAYIGLKAGHEFVHQAIADPAIRPIIERLMREEAAPSISATPEQDLEAYADALIARFENSALNHRLIQIAMDGSQKIPQRWLETLAFHAASGRSCPAILAGIAAWLHHIQGANGPLDDPRASELSEIATRSTPTEAIQRLFGPYAFFASAWSPSEDDIKAINAGLDALP
jgi:fructuronate reductase